MILLGLLKKVAPLGISVASRAGFRLEIAKLLMTRLAAREDINWELKTETTWSHCPINNDFITVKVR